MKLEVGKYYKHKENGFHVSIVGKVVTTMWEEVLVGESPESDDALIPFDGNVEVGDTWEEITHETWLEQFTDTSDEEPGDKEKLDVDNG